MPAFCIGTAATGVGDYGSQSGALDVPAALATELAEHVLDCGVDVAISAGMDVDHGTVQPLEKLFGDATAARSSRFSSIRSPPRWGRCTARGRSGPRWAASWPRWTAASWWWVRADCRTTRRCRR
jgi:2,3-dihydroxyphenylpropionate 1,2-dioxygenase